MVQATEVRVVAVLVALATINQIKSSLAVVFLAAAVVVIASITVTVSLVLIAASGLVVTVQN